MLQSVFTNARERLEQDGNLPSPVQSEQEEDDQEDDDDDQDSPKKRGCGPDKMVGLIFFPSKTNVTTSPLAIFRPLSIMRVFNRIQE